MTYEVQFRPRSDKDLDRLPPGVQRRVLERVEALASDPRPHGTQPLTGRLKGLRKLRVGD